MTYVFLDWALRTMYKVNFNSGQVGQAHYVVNGGPAKTGVASPGSREMAPPAFFLQSLAW